MSKPHPSEHDDEQSVLIIMTHGPSTPERCATPFYIATILASMDAQVDLFLTMESVQLARRGVAENLAAMPGGKPIIEFIRDARRAGARLRVCLPALPGYEMDAVADLIPEVDELAGGGVLGDLVLSCDKVLSF